MEGEPTQLCEFHLFHKKSCTLCTGQRLWDGSGTINCNPGASLYLSFAAWIRLRRHQTATNQPLASGLLLTKRFAVRDQFPIPRKWSGYTMYTSRAEVRLQVLLEEGQLLLFATLLSDSRHATDQRHLTIHEVADDGSSDSLGN